MNKRQLKALMKREQLKVLGPQDAAWTEIAEDEKQLEAIRVRGFETESDICLVQDCITLVLAEITYRRTEMLINEVAELDEPVNGA